MKRTMLLSTNASTFIPLLFPAVQIRKYKKLSKQYSLATITRRNPAMKRFGFFKWWSRGSALYLFLLLMIPYAPCMAQLDPATEQLAQDVLMERHIPSDAEMEQLDRNGDGKVDAADLVRIDTLLPPLVGFDQYVTVVSESAGSATVPLHFDRLFSGILSYRMNGEYRALSTSGLSANIPVSIPDDWAIEEDRMIFLTLQPSASSSPTYFVGFPHEHVLWISENDVLWRGRLFVDQLSSGVDIEIKKAGGSYQASLISDGFEAIPNGTWPVDLQMDATSFNAEIGPIRVAQPQTLLDTEFDRMIVLRSNPSNNPDHVFDPETRISGDMIDAFTSVSADRNHLNRSIHGAFTLLRGFSSVPVYQSELTDSMQ